MRKALTIIGLTVLLLSIILYINKVKDFKIEELRDTPAHAETVVEAPVSVPEPAPAPEPIPEPIVQPEPPVVPEPVYVAPVYTGSHEDWMAQAGIASSDYGYVDYIIDHESSWRVTVTNSIGAHGLCQSLPGNKMASAGADWYDNPITQLKWCNSYAISRYGSWAEAYNFWISNRWW